MIMQVLIVTGGRNSENFGSPWGVNHTEVKYFYHFNALIIREGFKKDMAQISIH